MHEGSHTGRQSFSSSSYLWNKILEFVSKMASSVVKIKQSNSSSASEQQQRKKIPGEIELEQWIEQAEYEIHIDTYRGIQKLWDFDCTDDDTDEEEYDNQENIEEGSMHSSLFVPPSHSSRQKQKYHRQQGPWIQQCSCLSYYDDNLDDKNTLTNAEIAVRMATHTSCPSLVAWTEKANANSKKKNNSSKSKSSSSLSSLYHLGQRPNDVDYRCPCDYNPFCWVSLGGAITEILQQQYYQRQQQLDHEVTKVEEKDVNTKVIIEINDDEDDGQQSRSSAEMYGDQTNDDDNAATIHMDWSNLDSPHYDPFTALRLKNVRTYCDIPQQSVREYLQNILGITKIIPLQECLHRIQEIHSQRYFTNPLLSHADNYNNFNGTQETLRIALPPGIENLGATCYLNTQLQCLARNRVLVEGIVEKWKATREDRISDVLKFFQKILVSIEHGTVKVLNTREFSNALGLDHFEQQDPNEFSRLLLDKFHESFQESSDVVRDLLPTIFQGVVRYEMTCLTCKSVSKRTEKFMDLNLPIVPPTEKGNQQPQKKKSKGQQSIVESFGKNHQRNNDTDVQICLDRYCETETFDGDNQYQCMKCGCKRDAQREMKFETLPPVLNIQLSRYVFDRQNCVKKKLSDKVLLPRKLYVRSDQEHEESESKRDHHVTMMRNAPHHTNTYILCAVMRHKGTSAYSGHYIAEAMDWMTGQWFEFNDEIVHILEQGPSSSYDPSATAEKQQAPPKSDMDTAKINQRKKGSIKSNNNEDNPGSKKINASVSGSTDAYNMYYVEESFLAQSALDEIRKVPVTFAEKTPAFETTRCTNITDKEGTIGVVEEMVSDRARVYSELTE
jgi:ubiquitin carboxyl-terminal hydrolase 48